MLGSTRRSTCKPPVRATPIGEHVFRHGSGGTSKVAPPSKGPRVKSVRYLMVAAHMPNISCPPRTRLSSRRPRSAHHFDDSRWASNNALWRRSFVGGASRERPRTAGQTQKHAIPTHALLHIALDLGIAELVPPQPPRADVCWTPLDSA